PATFRRQPAFAKGGRERYDGGENAESRFRSSLREINERRVPLTARAGRAYLDVLFFHPFEDGNARAGSLTLDFALAPQCIQLVQMAPLLMISRFASDRDGALSLVKLISILVQSTRRRTTTGREHHGH